MSSGDDKAKAGKVEAGHAPGGQGERGGRRVIDVRRIEVIDDRMAAVLRAMGPERRVARAFEMFAMMVEVTRCGARAAHPEWDDEQVEAELGRRIGHDRA